MADAPEDSVPCGGALDAIVRPHDFLAAEVGVDGSVKGRDAACVEGLIAASPDVAAAETSQTGPSAAGTRHQDLRLVVVVAAAAPEEEGG